MSNQDWKLLGAVATLGGVVVALHGITNKRWTDWHTAFAVMGAVATIATATT